jgi:hypothetical protein
MEETTACSSTKLLRRPDRRPAAAHASGDRGARDPTSCTCASAVAQPAPTADVVEPDVQETATAEEKESAEASVDVDVVEQAEEEVHGEPKEDDAEVADDEDVEPNVFVEEEGAELTEEPAD